MKCLLDLFCWHKWEKIDENLEQCTKCGEEIRNTYGTMLDTILRVSEENNKDGFDLYQKKFEKLFKLEKKGYKVKKYYGLSPCYVLIKNDKEIISSNDLLELQNEIENLKDCL